MQPGSPITREWLNRFFAAFHARWPVNATFIGVHDWDYRLPDFSERGAGDTLAVIDRLEGNTQQLSVQPGSGIVPQQEAPPHGEFRHAARAGCQTQQANPENERRSE